MYKTLILNFILLTLISAPMVLLPPDHSIRSAFQEIQTYVSKNKGHTSEKKFREDIAKILLDYFDIAELSQRTLGQKVWSEMSEEQKTKFKKTFSELLLSTYAKRFRQADQVTILILKVTEDFPQGRVETNIIQQENNYRINYRLHYNHDKRMWLIYDVIIEGISLVTNYRQEFRIVINKYKIDGLLEKLDEKLRSKKEDNLESFSSDRRKLYHYDPPVNWRDSPLYKAKRGLF